MESYIHEREVYKKLIWQGVSYWVLNELDTSNTQYIVIYATGEPQYPFMLFVGLYGELTIETFPAGVLVETLFVPKFKSIGTMQKLSGKIPEPFRKEGKVTEHIQLRLIETFGFLYVGDREYLLLNKREYDFNNLRDRQAFLATPNKVVASGKDNNDEVIWAYGSPRGIYVRGDYTWNDARTMPALVHFYKNTRTDNVIFVEEKND